LLTARKGEASSRFQTVEPTRAIGVVGAGLQTIVRDNVAAIIDSVTAQSILAIAVAVVGTSAVPGIGLANAIETRRGATFSNGVTDFTGIALRARSAFHTAAVGIADQTVGTLVIVATGHAMVAATDRAARTVRTALAAQNTA
jgi:hypothetical protein